MQRSGPHLSSRSRLPRRIAARFHSISSRHPCRCRPIRRGVQARDVNCTSKGRCHTTAPVQCRGRHRHARDGRLQTYTDRRRGIAELVGEGNRRQFDDPRFRRELALWIRSRRSGSGDVMPDVMSAVGRLVIRIFGGRHCRGGREKDSCRDARAGLLSSPAMNPQPGLRSAAPFLGSC